MSRAPDTSHEKILSLLGAAASGDDVHRDPIGGPTTLYLGAWNPRVGQEAAPAPGAIRSIVIDDAPVAAWRTWENVRNTIKQPVVVLSRWRLPALELMEVVQGWFLQQYAGFNSTFTCEDEHIIVAAHPRYHGFLATSITAVRDVGRLEVAIDASLVHSVTAHHLEGAVRAGQTRAVDLSLNLRGVARTGVAAHIRFSDGIGPENRLGHCIKLSLIPSRSVECAVASVHADDPADHDLLNELTRFWEGGLAADGMAAAVASHEDERARAGDE